MVAHDEMMSSIATVASKSDSISFISDGADSNSTTEIVQHWSQCSHTSYMDIKRASIFEQIILIT